MGRERDIEIWIGGKAFSAALNESITARQIYDALPLSGVGSRWGDEIYFDIGIELDPTNPQEEVEIGDIAYWRPGKALCLFYGRTPASTSDRPRAASPVTVVGKLVGNIAALKSATDLKNIEVKKKRC
jgi:hypothetical protein